MTNFEIIYNIIDKELKDLRKNIDKNSFNDNMFKLNYILGLIKGSYILCDANEMHYLHDLSIELDNLLEINISKIYSK